MLKDKEKLFEFIRFCFVGTIAAGIHYGIYYLLVEEFISGTRSNRVKEIAEALQKIDFEKYIDKFNMRNFAKNDIYPNIWEYEDEADEIKDDLRTSFESLRKFYAKMAEQESAVLVSIY